jgi:ABC-2 type transport system ATP-binding protein
MTTTVVAFDQVSQAYGEGRAVDGLSLTLHPGETVALLGLNGAGKSTALDLLLGLKHADSGTVPSARPRARPSSPGGWAPCCTAAG